ncbi:cyclin-like protein [Aspergillus californicus]
MPRYSHCGPNTQCPGSTCSRLLRSRLPGNSRTSVPRTDSTVFKDRPEASCEPTAAFHMARFTHGCSFTQSGPGEYRNEGMEEDEEDEEDEDDGVEGDAHFRQPRENYTLGEAATSLCPERNQQVASELALANQVADTRRTVEGIQHDYNASMDAEYGEEIYEYMREQENKLLPKACFIDNWTETQRSMRTDLLGWLVQRCQQLSLPLETLFLAINYIDRYLSRTTVLPGEMRLVGVTAIAIAVKYEGNKCPPGRKIIGRKYTAQEIDAERCMLAKLQYELGWPGPIGFLSRISKVDSYDRDTFTIAKYLLQRTILDERLVGSPPSFLAAGAYCLARLMQGKDQWTCSHVYYSGYTLLQLHPLICHMLEHYAEPCKHHHAVYTKSDSQESRHVSLSVAGMIRNGPHPPEPANKLPVPGHNGTGLCGELLDRLGTDISALSLHSA